MGHLAAATARSPRILHRGGAGRAAAVAGGPLLFKVHPPNGEDKSGTIVVPVRCTREETAVQTYSVANLTGNPKETHPTNLETPDHQHGTPSTAVKRAQVGPIEPTAASWEVTGDSTTREGQYGAAGMFLPGTLGRLTQH